MYKILFAVLVYPLSLFSMRVLYVFSDISYFFVYKLVGYRKSVVVQNLSRSFPEKKYDEIQAITRRFYRHFCDLFMEMLKYYSINENYMKKRIKYTNIEMLDELYSEGKNVILLSGHYGNWESLSILPKYIHAPVGAVYSPLSGKFSDKLITHIRTRFGVKMYPMKHIAKHILSNKYDSAVYLFIADQSPSAQSKHNTIFMNQSTLFFNGAEKLAKITQSAVVYLHSEKIKRGYYTGTFSIITKDGSLENEGVITARFIELLEANINENSIFWLWSHKRWKHNIGEIKTLK